VATERDGWLLREWVGTEREGWLLTGMGGY
jgi:hypothetical protein